MVWIYQIEHSLSRIDAFYDGLSPLRLAEPAEVSIQYITLFHAPSYVSGSVADSRGVSYSRSSS
jgi:hypothetical protein